MKDCFKIVLRSRYKIKFTIIRIKRNYFKKLRIIISVKFSDENWRLII
jgi:hypothetical protein